MKTIDQCSAEDLKKGDNYNYQKELTNKLDSLDDTFTQATINQIVLWEVNRYAELKSSTLEALNKIDPSDQILDIDYLKVLKDKCRECNIEYTDADRRLYALDKKYNAGLKIKY